MREIFEQSEKLLPLSQNTLNFFNMFHLYRIANGNCDGSSHTHPKNLKTTVKVLI